MSVGSELAAVAPRWTRRSALAFLLAFAAACASPSRSAREPAAVRLVVLHTNDIHGQVLPRPAAAATREDAAPVGGLSRVAALVARERRREEREGAGVLVLDGGDWYQGTPEGAVDAGLPFVRAIAAAGFDATCLGNHDLDHGLANLLRLLDRARPPALCANVRERESGERVDWIEPWRIVEVSGLRVAIVGLLTPTTPAITHPDASRFVFADPSEELARVEEELAGRFDLLIPLAHIGVEEAAKVARAHPELPLIVTGHSHTFLPEGRREGGTLIVQAGAKASVVGRVDLLLDRESGKALEASAKLLELAREPAREDRNARVDELAAEMAARADAAMGEVVGELEAPLAAGRGPRSTVAGNWVADRLRERAGADVAFHNRGGLRAEIDAGPVTRREVFEMLPFDNHVVTVELSGAELERLVRRAVEGRAHSGLDFSGLRAIVRSSASGVVLERVEIAGEPLDPERFYRAATNSFLAAGGDDYVELARAKRLDEDPILLRELATEAFLAARRIAPPREERILDLSEAR